TEGESLQLTFESLFQASDADPETVHFRVTRISNGELLIGGLPFDPVTNNRIDYEHPAEWIAPLGSPRSDVPMFSLVSVSWNGKESVPAVSVKTSAVQPLEVTWTGKGTEKNPYKVTSAAHLHAIRYQPYANYELTTDIDLGVEPWNRGRGWAPVKDFYGSLKGNGHTISGLMINRPDQDEVGLIGSVHSDTRLQGLHIVDASVTGADYTGILLGRGWYSVLSGNSVSGRVEGLDRVGGLVGETNNDTVENNYVHVDVVGGSSAGGLVGSAELQSILSANHVSGSVY